MRIRVSHDHPGWYGDRSQSHDILQRDDHHRFDGHVYRARQPDVLVPERNIDDHHRHASSIKATWTSALPSASRWRTIPAGARATSRTPNAVQPAASFDISVNIADPTAVYTLINSAYGDVRRHGRCGRVRGDRRTDYTVDLVEGQNIRDHNNDSYNNTDRPGRPGRHLSSAPPRSAGARSSRRAGFVLPAAFQSATLTDIILLGDGERHRRGRRSSRRRRSPRQTVRSTSTSTRSSMPTFKPTRTATNYPLGGTSLSVSGSATLNVQGGLTINGQGGLSVGPSAAPLTSAATCSATPPTPPLSIPWEPSCSMRRRHQQPAAAPGGHVAGPGEYRGRGSSTTSPTARSS